MTDWSGFVGIPYQPHGRDRAGCDCWGLVRIIYAEAYGIELPAYAGDYPCEAERARVAGLVSARSAAPPWSAVDVARRGDLLVLRVNGLPSHVGVALDDRRMLHARTQQSEVERFDGGAWRRRIAGVYRHEALA